MKFGFATSGLDARRPERRGKRVLVCVPANHVALIADEASRAAVAASIASALDDRRALYNRIAPGGFWTRGP